MLKTFVVKVQFLATSFIFVARCIAKIYVRSLSQYFYQPVHNSGNDRIGNDSYIAVFTLIVDFDDRLTEILRNARKEQLKNRIPYGELYHKNYYREVKDKNRVYYEFYHLDGVLERV